MVANRTGILGLDLGQRNDRSCATILTRRPRAYDPIAERYSKEQYGPWDERWRCISIRRWTQHTPYPEVVADVLRAPEEAGVGVIVAEYNGVGGPIVDFMCQEAQRRQVGQLKIVPVDTAPSSTRYSASEDPHGRFKFHRVPKVDLVASAMLLADRGLLAFSSKIPEVTLLLEEMRLFKMKYTKAANLQFGNEPGAGKHDDMVVSLCLSCWWAQRMRTFNFYAG